MTPTQPPLVPAKLSPPPLPPHAVARPRLLTPLLNDGWRLAVVTGGPGSGKSVAARQCCAASDSSTPAWVSLDETDDRPERFWLCVVAALDRAAPGAFPRTAARVSDSGTDVWALVTELVVEASALEHPVALILDDFHTIRSRGTVDGVGFLVEHLPVQLRMIVTSRTDLPLPVATWIGRSWVVELRQHDLAFSPAETHGLFEMLDEHRLGTADIELLCAHTEGLVAALHLAAIAIRDSEDAPSAARYFSGRHRLIADLIVSEVLEGQPADVQQFLLRTSIVDQFDAGLADALTGRRDGAELLAWLPGQIVFLMAVDDERTSFRYHRLLRDLLRTELERRHTQDVVALGGSRRRPSKHAVPLSKP